MQTRSKIFVPYILTIIIFILFLFIFHIFNNRQINEIVKYKSNQQKENFSDISELRSNLLKRISKEIINNHEIENYFKTRDTIFFSKAQKILNNYELSIIWIKTKSSSDLIQSKKIPIKIKLPEIISNDTSYENKHYFFITENGLMEFIVNDLQSADKGALIIGKIWDEKYVQEIEKIMDADIVIHHPGEKVSQEAMNPYVVSTGYFLGIDNKVSAKIFISKEHPLLKTLNSNNKFIAFFIVLFAVTLVAILLFSFQISIVKPINKLVYALNTEDESILKSLSGRKDEYGKISEIIEDFFRQRNLLNDEISLRKQNENRIQESANKYKNLLDNIFHGIFITTPEGKVIEANMELAKILGYTNVEDVYKLNVKNDIYYFPKQRKTYLTRLNEDGYLKNAEVNMKNKDGQVFTCLLNARTIYDETGNVAYYEGTLTDISEYKNLRQQLQKLELAVSQSIDGVALVDKNRNFEYINESWARMHGYRIEELIGKNINICFNDDEILKNELEPAFEEMTKNEHSSGEVRHTHRNGRVFLTSMSNTIIKDWGGNTVGYVIIANDLTERVLAEQEIRRLYKELEEKIYLQNSKLYETNIKLQKTIEKLEAKEKELSKNQQLYLKTINASNEWIHYIDSNYNFVFINESLMNIHNVMGINYNVIGKNLKEVYYFMDKKIFDEYDYVFETKKTLIDETTNKYGGKTFHTENIKAPVIEKDKVVGIITILRDITERKELERKILAAVLDAEEKEKKRFSEDLHDGLGALLSTMKIYVNAVLKKNTIEEAYDLLNQLKQIIYEAVENTRNIAFNMTPNILVDFGLIRAIKSLCDKINSTQDIFITLNSSEINERIEANVEVNVFRIIQELINNSLKHSQATNIDININIDNGKLTVVYTDNGQGFSLNKSDKSVNGIGINNIFARIKLLNGDCKIESDEGKGIRVMIEINNVNNL